MTLPTFTDIQQAHALLKGHIIETPTLYSAYLSRAYGACVYLKLENFQETGSFKTRGTCVKMKNLSKDVLQKGVIAMSAGNHAQAVAFHAHKLNVSAIIVMPTFTPPMKVGSTEKWGAQIILAGQTFEEAHEVAEEIRRRENLTFIHPYDDPLIIAGQGTIGIEMLKACPDLEILLVPIGGGGLCAGLAIAAKSLKPSLRIYGVEIEGYASMAHTLYGREEKKQGKVTLAEGVAVKTPGQLTRVILKDWLDDIIVVTEAEIEQAVDIFARKLNMIAEGAGAVGLAAILHRPTLITRKKVGLVVSGGNIDARLVSSVMIRGQIHEGNLALLRFQVEDVPGMLEQISKIISDHRGNILEVKHQRLIYEIPIKMAELDIMVEMRGVNHTETLIKELIRAGFTVSKFTSSLDWNGLSR